MIVTGFERQPTLRRLDMKVIQARLEASPRLPSLRTIDSALRELLNADQRYTQQIAEIIRRDPSLTARLLRLVNSVYFGLSTPVNNLEEAVLYLGLRQIRQLVMATPILEDFQKLTSRSRFSWRAFWQHCIGTAILTREVMSALHQPSDETDYVAGLMHDVGKIAMAHAFPDYFHAIYEQGEMSAEELLRSEEELLGTNHAELGAMFLQLYNLPEVLVNAARYHHAPEAAASHAQLVSAVQIADLLMRHAKIGRSGSPGEITETDWINATGWGILFPQSEQERAIAQAALKRSIERLPMLLDGLI